LDYTDHGEYLLIERKSEFEYINLNGDFRVSYPVKIKGEKLVFSPLLRAPWRGRNMNQNPIPSLMDFGYGEVEVIPPEPIV
jgi:hypothetical protein